MSMITAALDNALRNKTEVTIRLKSGRLHTGTLIDVTEETVRMNVQHDEVWFSVEEVEAVTEAAT